LVSTRAAKASPWSYTDDGAMNIAVAESIVAAGTVAPEHILRRLAAHYEPARGFGRGMKLALEAFASGTPWDRCALAAWPEGSQGNGGAVRITPVACAAWSSQAAFTRAVDLTTRVTHTHEEAVAAAQLHANAVVVALQTDESSFDSQAFVAELRRRACDLPQWVDAALLRLGELVGHSVDHVDVARALGTSPFARESVFAALWAFLSSPATYAGAVTSAALLGKARRGDGGGHRRSNGLPACRPVTEPEMHAEVSTSRCTNVPRSCGTRTKPCSATMSSRSESARSSNRARSS
jgi:poly(ADP-ribose) glycohydrolase ARH3